MLRHRLMIALAIFFMTALSGMAAGHAVSHPAKLEPETLNYKVMFKWGLINKQAGRASLALTHTPKGYSAMLAAASEPWADKIYRVRDTLNGRMTYADLTPKKKKKIAHEGGEHKHDVVKYNYSTPGKVSADCIRRVYKKGELKVDERRQLSSEGDAIDMLSSFYYMRTLPFEKWAKGHVQTIDIFSGKRKELLSIKYHGIDNLDIDGVKHPTYHITFTFTSGNGEKTSDDMDAWIATDKSRIPLRLEGRLPVGKVHCIYTGSGKQ